MSSDAVIVIEVQIRRIRLVSQRQSEISPFQPSWLRIFVDQAKLSRSRAFHVPHNMLVFRPPAIPAKAHSYTNISLQ